MLLSKLNRWYCETPFVPTHFSTPKAKWDFDYNLWEVWIFENQTEEGEEEVIFKRDKKENWFTLQRR